MPTEAQAAVSEPQTIDLGNSATEASKRTWNFVFGTQRLLNEESAFVRNEMLDRINTETHLFSEFLSKVAEAHSVNDYKMMYEACSRHQLDFIRRDCERLFKHAERSVELWSRLLSGL